MLHFQMMTLSQRGHGATAARLTPDQKVGNSNLSALTFSAELPYRNDTNLRSQQLQVRVPVAAFERFCLFSGVAMMAGSHAQTICFRKKNNGLFRELNPGPLAP